MLVSFIQLMPIPHILTTIRPSPSVGGCCSFSFSFFFFFSLFLFLCSASLLFGLCCRALTHEDASKYVSFFWVFFCPLMPIRNPKTSSFWFNFQWEFIFLISLRWVLWVFCVEIVSSLILSVSLYHRFEGKPVLLVSVFWVSSDRYFVSSAQSIVDLGDVCVFASYSICLVMVCNWISVFSLILVHSYSIHWSSLHMSKFLKSADVDRVSWSNSSQNLQLSCYLHLFSF